MQDGCWNGRFTEVTMLHMNDVLLRGGDDALSVHWLQITVVNAKTGGEIYHKPLHHLIYYCLSVDNIAAVAQAGQWALEDRKRREQWA